MALRGILSDFGIADVFSLIGSQNKSGVLTVQSRDEQVKLYFVEGAAVACDATGRKHQDMIGQLLVRAEILTDAQLKAALQEQNADRRLGDVLLAQGLATSMELQTMARLQTTETVYRFFLWRHGTYEFAQHEPAPTRTHAPVRAEALLMEGLRQSDQWPAIRQQITSYSTRFNVTEDLNELLIAGRLEDAPVAAPQDEFAFDLGFGEGGDEAPQNSRLRGIGDAEKLVFTLIHAERDVQKLIDLSRLGEFDTCKALTNLMAAGFIWPRIDTHVRPSAEATVGGMRTAADAAAMAGMATPLAAAVATVLVWLVLCTSGLPMVDNAAQGFLDTSLQAAQGGVIQPRIVDALAAYRAAHGTCPQSLSDLAHEGFVDGRDLHFPWTMPYDYTCGEQGHTLVRPLY